MSNEITLTDSNFDKEVLKETGQTVLVDFWAPWCGPCKMLGPIIEELADEFSGQLKVCKLNVDEARQTALQYQIRSIPTILFFKEGQPVDQSIGVIPKDQIKKKIQELI